MRLLYILLFVAGCGTRAPLPPLPQVNTASFAPAIREAVDAAMADARSNQNDAGKVGRLGMVFQAHEQRAPARACYQRAASLDAANFDWKYYLGMVSDGPAAAEAFRAALRQRDYLPAKIRLGEALLAAGDSEGAAGVLRDIQHPAAWFNYGRATNDPAYYEKALAAFPEYGAAIFALAQHYRRSGRQADADRLMARYDTHRLTAPTVEDPLLDAVRALNQGPDRLMREATRAESEGQLAAAIELQLKALALDPKLAQAHVNLISLYGRTGDAARAEQHYRQAVTIEPAADGAHYNFGVLCFQTNRFAEAQTAFARTLSINPGHADAQHNLGVLMERQGKLKEAAEHFDKAIASRPDFPLAHFHLGRILANQRKYPEAIAHLERAGSGDDEATPTYLYALGATLARSGEVMRAASVLQDAQEKAQRRGQQQLAATISRDLARLRR